MNTQEEFYFLSMFLEGFLYGKTLFLCTFNLYPAKEVQLELLPRLGIYSGIFSIYLQCVLSKESRTTTIIFYALCLLYVLSTATIVGDLLEFVIRVSNNSIFKYIIFYQLCRHYLFNFKLTHSQCYFALRLSKS